MAQNFQIFDVPWRASMCSLCNSWFNRARDLSDHFEAVHLGESVRFRCGTCGCLSARYHGAVVHHAKCRGPGAAGGGFLCRTDGCGRRFASQRGLTIHRNSAHPDERNQERLEEPLVPQVRGLRAGRWSAEEDEILLARYFEFRGGGARRMGYSAFVAGFLPLKTEIQVRQRVRTLRVNGLLLAPPDLPGLDGESSDEEGEGEEGGVAPGPVVGLERPPSPAPVDRELQGEGAEVAPVDGGQFVPPLPGPPLSPVALTPPLIPDFDNFDNAPEVAVFPDGREEVVLDEAVGAGRVVAGEETRDPPGAPGPGTAGEAPPGVAPDDGLWAGVLAHILQIRDVCPIGVRLKRLAERDQDITAELEQAVADLQREIVESVPVAERPRRPRGEGGVRRLERTRRRVARYARTQELFKRNPSRLAELVLKDELEGLDGVEERREPPVGVVDLYEQLWGSVGPCLLQLPAGPVAADVGVRPFSVDEVRARMKRLKPGGAPGLDGVTRGGLLGRPHVVGTLAVLFNIILFRGVYPSCWLKNRTTLIPKAGKDHSKPENWRPITIAPLLARMYSGALESRLLQFVTVSDRQRGFRPGNGCYVNCTILDEVIRLGKRSSLVGVQLDVSKAFDTVSHAAIDHVLVAQGVPSVLREAVRHMYRRSTTLLGTLGAEIELKRGVKQGDPLSPLLFNLVMDPLLNRLNATGLGFQVGAESVAAMAYADDLTLFSGSVRGMERLLAETSDFLSSVGMRLSVPKCMSFRVEKRGDAWVALETGLSVDGQPIGSCSASTPFDYLGLTYTLAKGFSNRQHISLLEQAVGRARRLALKPQQKVQLLMQYVVPTFCHRFSIDPPSKNDLTRVDRMLRGEVKRILHLLPCTTDGLLYSRKRDGGLGFPRLETQLRHSALKLGLDLLWGGDQLLDQLRAVSGWEARLSAIAGQLGLQWPPALRDIASSKRQVKMGFHGDWSRLAWQGAGVEWFRDDPLGNHWLLQQSCLRPGQFIDALQMRTNTYGTRTAISRAARDVVTVCRRCREQPETLGHVLGQCIAGSRARIERHDCVARIIREECLSGGSVVAREQEFLDIDRERLRPDLVVKRGDTAFVVDVTVRFENGPSLAAAALEKKVKYARILPEVQRQLATTRGEVIPVVVGSRGAMPQSTVTALRKIGITRKNTLLDIALTALRTSLDIGRRHLDYG